MSILGAEDEQRTRRRAGAWCAAIGAAVSVADGAGFANLTNTAPASGVLDRLAGQASWLWPASQLGFAVGAVLWAAAFFLLQPTATAGVSQLLASLAALTIDLGATIHITDALISGSALPQLAALWASTPPGPVGQIPRLDLLARTDSVLEVLSGLWAGVLILFHGAPFVLAGVAVLADHRAPRVVAVPAIVGGTGSLGCGVAFFVPGGPSPTSLFIIFALVDSAWMVLLAVLVTRRRSAPPGH